MSGIEIGGRAIVTIPCKSKSVAYPYGATDKIDNAIGQKADCEEDAFAIAGILLEDGTPILW